MPHDTEYPGVYLEERSGAPATIGARDGATAFVGAAARGEALRAVRVDGVASAARAVGAGRSALGDAARRFFAHGGTRLWLVRTPPRAAGAPPADWATALDAVGALAVLAFPGTTDRATLAAARAYAEGRGAMLIVDLPRAARDLAAIDRWVRGAGDALRSASVAAYVPWLLEPDARAASGVRAAPPSAAVAAVWARFDAAHGPWKSPAGTSATLGGVALDAALGDDAIGQLATHAVNTLREFPGRGPVVWGARTLRRAGDGDEALKYVAVRRLLLHVEESVQRGLAWAAFAPNDAALWTQVRGAVENFLYTLWRGGALLGTKPEQAYFVRCDRTTMTQADLDAGRLVCLVGIAPLRPAEFVIFRIGQWTADRA